MIMNAYRFKLGRLFLVLMLWGSNYMEALAKNSIEQGVLLHKEGIQYQGQRKYDQALEKYHQALRVWNELLEAAEKEKRKEIDERVSLGLIKAHFNQANIFYRTGDYQEAEKSLQKCINLQIILEENYNYRNPLRRGRAHRELGKVYTRTRGFDVAYEQLRLAEQFLSVAVPVYSQDMGTLENAFSLLFLKWSEGDSLLMHSTRKYQIYEQLGNEYFKASALVSQAVGKELLNDLTSALSKIDSALNYYLTDTDTHGLTIAKSYNNKAHILAKMDELRTAIELEDQVISMIAAMPVEIEPLQEMINAYNSKAYFFLLMKDYRLSLVSSDSALTINTSSAVNQDSDIEKKKTNAEMWIYNKLGYLNSLGYKAKAFAGLQNYSKAKEAFTLAIDYLNKIRREYNDTESKLKLTEIAKVIFEGAIALHLDPAVDEPERAFAYAEQSKAFTLLEGIKHSKALRIAKVSEALLDQEYQARADIARMERQYLNSETAEEKTDWLQAVRAKKEELRTVMAKLQRNKEYRQLMSFDAPKIRRIQRKALGKDQTLVEYFVGEEKTYVFVIPKRGKMEVLQIPIKGKALNQKVDQFWSSIYHYGCDTVELKREAPALATLEASEREELLKSRYLELGQELYQLLFAPVQALELGSRFVIVPDEGLSYLPFDALLEGVPEIDQFSFYPYLGQKYALSYAYSGNLLLEMQGGSHAKAQQILAFAPSFDSRTLALNKSALSRLTNNQTEVKAICELFSDQCLQKLDTEATREAFVELVKDNAFYIIHLSTHGKANDKNPNQSWISFTQRHQELDESQLLYASDLYALPIQADLVVLSACETNKGRLRRGEGIMSFARGLSAAGVRSVLSTFWVIGESPSLLVMKDFYQGINAGIAKDVALQSARKNLMMHSDFSHPYYWSAFVPIGQMSEVEPEWPWWWVLLAIGVVLGLFSFSKLTKPRA